MAGFKHATKKKFAKSTTRKRTIQSGISAEYMDNRKKLDSVSASIKSLIKEIKAARDVWLAVAKHQKDFSEALVASLPVDGVVRSHAKEVESTVRQLQRLILEDEGAACPHKRIISVLEGYLRLVQNVAKDYPQLETTYTELLRYQKKVDKLSKKGKKETILGRNMDKLTSARNEHDRNLQEVIKRQAEAYNKHEAVFQCAHHAFWIAHDKYAQVVNEATKSIRWESIAVREHLVNIDVANSPKLNAIPRVHLLLPPEEVRDVTMVRPESGKFGSASGSPPSKNNGVVIETVPSRRILEPIPAVDATPKQQQVVTSVPFQHIVETVPMQNAQMQTSIQSMPIPTEAPLYTRNAPAPIQIAHPARAEVVHMVPTTTYTYQQQPQQTPIVHLTPEKPLVSVSLPPDAVGPTAPTDIPLPSAPPQSTTTRVAHVLA